MPASWRPGVCVSGDPLCAGLFPACFKHLSLFFSEGELSLAYAIMLTALSCSQVMGGPLAGGLQYITAGGLYGFQWLFIIEGIVTVMWGCCIWVGPCPSFVIVNLLSSQ